MAIRTVKGKNVIDTRELYLFVLSDGRKAGTKSLSREEAKKFIEETLKLKIAA